MIRLKIFSIMSENYGSVESTGYQYLDSKETLVYKHYGANYQLFITSVS